MSRSRAGKAELIRRREEIQRLILVGTTTTEILDTMSLKWKTTRRAIQDDLMKIGKDWAAKAPEETQKMRNAYADRLELMFHAAMESGNLKVALEIQKEIHKLNAVYTEKEKTENDNVPKFINISRRDPLKVVGGE
jgi:hypothetical protein